ncbi:hypothetical protein Catovirus_1_1047 [Catovirus CTV1]|uniref:Uncharacterized protein n=1 Tax=Catovirus CTV1 TaxID=1977631 RepID=A0A1V0SBA1_9VIRU|nr:hypothetical protein Catovirus_1_1047 [Catovirus CTV1]
MFVIICRMEKNEGTYNIGDKIKFKIIESIRGNCGLKIKYEPYMEIINDQHIINIKEVDNI